MATFKIITGALQTGKTARVFDFILEHPEMDSVKFCQCTGNIFKLMDMIRERKADVGRLISPHISSKFLDFSIADAQVYNTYVFDGLHVMEPDEQLEQAIGKALAIKTFSRWCGTHCIVTVNFKDESLKEQFETIMAAES